MFWYILVFASSCEKLLILNGIFDWLRVLILDVSELWEEEGIGKEVKAFSMLLDMRETMSK